MKITNKTHWDARDIVKLIYRIAKEELNVGQLKNRGHVILKYQRGARGRLGDCHIGTMASPTVYMRLFLPRTGEVDTVKLAKVIAHELGHAKGLDHWDMNRTCRYGWKEGWREFYAWAADYKVRVKTSAIKPPKEERIAKRRADAVGKAEKMVKKWETAVKRSNTMLKKWKIRLKTAQKRTELPITKAQSDIMIPVSDLNAHRVDLPITR